MQFDISSGLSALSVIFGVAVFHIGASNHDVEVAINSSVAPSIQAQERRKHRKYIWNTFLFKSLPSLLMLLAIFLVMLPKFIEHLFVYSLELWNFNFIITLYQILLIIVFFYLVVSISATFRLLYKLTKMF